MLRIMSFFVTASSSIPDPAPTTTSPTSSSSSGEPERSEGLGKAEIIALCVSLPLGIGSLVVAYLAWRYPVQFAKTFHVHGQGDSQIAGVAPPGEKDTQALGETLGGEDDNKAELIIVESSKVREVS